MITSILSKSKPINFLIVFLIALLAAFAALYKYSDLVINSALLTKVALVFLGCFISALLLDFIVTKNSLSKRGNTEVLIFSSFLLTIPQVFLNWEVVVSNLLVLLALRRILSIRTQNDHIKKLFDAGFLIGFASLFYFWSLLFFILIFVALLFHAESELKKWITPCLGLITIAIISMSLSIIIHDDFLSVINLDAKVGFNFSAYNSVQFITAITVLLSFGLWSSLFYLKDINNKKRTFRPSYKIVFVACMIATILIIIDSKKEGSEFLFLFALLAIIISNYIETIDKKWFKELFTITLLLIPFALLIL